jgi:hypothetical protein
VAKSKKETIIDLGDMLVFEKVKRLKLLFDKTITSQSNIRIVSDHIVEIDLTGVQLLEYFILRSGALDKKLVYSVKMADDRKLMLLKNGFSNLIETINA